MSDNPISQSEIDALLSGGNGAGNAPDMAALQGFAGKMVGQFASGLEGQAGVHFEAGTVTAESLTKDQVLARLPDSLIAVSADFSQGITGSRQFFLAPEFAQKLTDLINKEENAELDDMALTIVSDAISKYTASEIEELNKLNKVPGLSCKPPEARQTEKTGDGLPQDVVLFSYQVSAEGAQYTVWEAVSKEAAAAMSEALVSANPSSSRGVLSEDEIRQMTGGAPASSAFGSGFGGSGLNIPNVKGLSFPSLNGITSSGEQGNIGLIMDVFMEMTVELGRTRKQIKEILAMGEGTIIELEKLAGEPVDILVNHKPIAKGEVVVIDENFGVRVTEILSPMDRVNDLQ
ncbi:MAG: flagellar motor switch protein FliN [Treponema sp.]|nr:flagellar motor switch protein FliN [Treponema sp.]